MCNRMRPGIGGVNLWVHSASSADIEMLKANIAHRKHDHGVKLAENHADLLEMETVFAVDCAVSSLNQAEVAILDAIAARLDFEDARMS